MVNRGRIRLIVLATFTLSIFALLGAQQPAVRVGRDATAATLDQLLPISPEITVATLRNGLVYYVRANKEPLNRAELRLVVNAGSVLEDDDQRGLAHFTEHMAFNGTAHFAKNELIRFMESIGMRFGPSVNAYTGFDETVYMLTVPTDKPEILEKAFLVLEDWAHNLSFDPVEIDKERGVIVEEWRLGRGAGARIQDQQLPILMKGSRYAERLPIGKKEVIETFTHDTLKRFYRDWYRPDLMAVIAVGDFDRNAVEGLIRKHFAGLANPRTERARSVYQVPDQSGTQYSIAADKEMPQTQVSVYNKIPVRDQSTVGSYRDKIVERLFLGMLNYRLSDLTQRADAPFAMAMSTRGRLVRSKEANIMSAAVKEGGGERGLDAVLTEAARVARFGFTQTEFDRQKRELMRNRETLYAERDRRQSASIAAEFVRAFTQAESIPGSEFEYALHQRFVPEITLAEVNAISRAFGADRNRVILLSAPQKEGVAVPDEPRLAAVVKAVASKTIDAYVDAVADVSLLDRLPEGGAVAKTATREDYGITEWELTNGVKVVLKPTAFKADDIQFRASSFGGNSRAADGDFNAIRMADRLVQVGGLGQFDAIALRKVLAGRVANVVASISETEEGLSGSGSPKDIETLFQLIYLTFTRPRGDAEAVAAFKAQGKAMLSNQQASPSFAFAEAMQKALTQDHPRGRTLTAELVDELNLEKSLALYKDRFADASDFTFVFVGTFDLATVRPLVERYLGGLPSTRRQETWRDVGMRPPAGVVQRSIHKGIEPKSQVGIVFTGPFEYDAQHRVVIRALANILQTRLRELVREELGGTYGISASARYTKVPEQRYEFQIQWGCNPERVDELVKAVFGDITAIRASGPTGKQLGDVREQLLRDFETNSRQNSYLATQLYFRYLYNEDVRTLFEMPEAYKKLTPAVIQEAARTYLNPENYVQLTLLPEPRTTPEPGK